MFISFLIALLCAPLANATEGFSADLKAAPAAVIKAWDATFALVTKSPKFHNGTAFLIFQTLEDNQIALYFLTADHNVTMCEQNKTCPATELIQNVRFQERPTQIDLDKASGLRFDQVDFVAELTDSKMALLKVAAPKDTQGLPEPLQLPKDCSLRAGSKLYGIGWPWTPLRNGSTSLPIANSDQIVKRWSQGMFIGYFKFTDEKQAQFATSVDSLVGSSGGPIIDEDGVVVSLVNKAKTAPDNSYVGDDDESKLTYQTMGPRCEFFKAIRESLGL